MLGQRRNITWIIVAVLLVAAAILYFLFDPAGAVWMPKCPLHLVTGLNCPGCGSQRMIHALLHGDFAGALKANALLFCALPLIAFLLWLEVFHKRMPKLYMKVYSTYTALFTGIILVGWFIFRNIFGI